MDSSDFDELVEDNGMLLSIIFILTLFFGIFIGFFISWFNLIYITLHPVDKNSERHGGGIVAEVLKSHGVKYVFTLVGGHISPILVAAEKLGIKVIDTRHEANAVFAADAVARLSGTVGVAVVTAGPGITNTITATKNAQLAESPVVLIGGASAAILKGRGALQDIDQMSLFQSVCKYRITVTSVRDIVPALKHAFHEAQSDTPGPVFVECPVDVLYSYGVVQQEVLKGMRASNLRTRIISWYLNNYVENIFAGAWETRNIDPIPPSIPLPNSVQIQTCVELLSQSKRPLIIVGSQAVLPPISAEMTKRGLNSLGIPCFLSGMARGLLGRKSNLHIRHQRSQALKNADLVILAGAVCDFRLSYGRVLSRKSKIIAVNRSSEQLYRNSGIFWNPSLAICGDVGTFIQELNFNIPNYKCDTEWLGQLHQSDKEKEDSIYKMSLEPTDKYLNPLKVLFELEKILPDNAILVADGGDFVGTAAYILRPGGPLQWLDPGAFGTLGVGGGFALGAKLCRPDSEVWIIYGDGSCGYTIPEFDTFTRHGIRVLALVGNDAGWTQIAREQIPMFGTDVACNLAYTDYHKVAEGFGGKGLTVSDPDTDISSVFEEAQRLYAEGKSVLINVLIGKTKFRDGSISL